MVRIGIRQTGRAGSPGHILAELSFTRDETRRKTVLRGLSTSKQQGVVGGVLLGVKLVRMACPAGSGSVWMDLA